MRKQFVIISSVLLIITLAHALYLDRNWFVVFGIILIFTIMGYIDMVQTRHTIRRIYPVVGRLRYVLE